MTYRLWHAKGTCALASWIALEEAGADYRIEPIDFGSAEQRAAPYLAINPRGRVPALETPHGVLTETPAILAFIAQTFPKARLAPTEPYGFAKMQEFNNFLCATVHVSHAHRRRGARWADDAKAIEAMQGKVQENMQMHFAAIERDLFKGPWVLGEDYSVCDPYLFTIATWLAGDGVDIAAFPKLAGHHERLRARSAVRRVLERQSEVVTAGAN